MGNTDTFHFLSPEQRLRRIGALFSKAATLAFIRNIPPEPLSPDGSESRGELEKSPATPEGTLRGPIPSKDLALLERFYQWGKVTPRDAARFWEASRATTYRRLLRLEKDGWMIRHGATRATHYSITEKSLRLLKGSQTNAGSPRNG
jgi:hypothetical protein